MDKSIARSKHETQGSGNNHRCSCAIGMQLCFNCHKFSKYCDLIGDFKNTAI